MSNEIAHLSDGEALDRVAQIIDGAANEQNAQLTTLAFNIIRGIEGRKLQPRQVALLHYFKANAWANRIQEQGELTSWSWEQAPLQNQLLELRRALNHKGFTQLDIIRQCQIYTNLANQLNAIGRFIEAIDCWDKALKLEPKFAMAHANRGLGFECYARSVYDPGHKAMLMLTAHDAYEAAIASDAIFESSNREHLVSAFEQCRQAIVQFVDLGKARTLLENPEQHLKGSEEENRYKTWILKRRLYINPLNDAGAHPIACKDVMTLPSITVPLDSASFQPPPIIGFYNQLKQEYVSARFLLFESLQSVDTHYSDEDVLLYNTLDYPSYGLSTEKLRLVYRMAYSLFDKMAFGINRYFELGHNDNTVSFRAVWYMPRKEKKKIIHSALKNRENWPLRGLFWLAKDFYEDEFKSSTEPDAAQIAIIRNHLEHKFLKIHSDLAGDVAYIPAQPSDWAHHISRDEFEAKTLRLLQLARAALIYLSAAIYHEEQKRAHERGDTFAPPMSLGHWDDEWKR